jgi:N-acetylglutamate synthase-like GNAT family acetyltransferase
MRSHVSGNTIFNSLLDKHPEVRFELYPTEKAKRVYLTGFIVPPAMRGTGVGTAFMEDLIELADKDGWMITLTPSSSYGGNVSRLKEFYKRFGFVENKGSNRDFSHKEDMYRSPKGGDSLNEEIERIKATLSMLEGKGLDNERSIEDKIKYVRGVSDELKDFALSHLERYTRANKGKISGLQLHPDLKKKIKEKNLPDGFSMGVDKDGYYIHTHRARSKSYENPGDISIKDIKFIDSTG